MGSISPCCFPLERMKNRQSVNGIKERKAVQILRLLWEAIEEGDQECMDERNMMAFMQSQESAGNPASSGDRPWVEVLKLTVKAMVEDNDCRSSPMEAMRRERRLRDIVKGGSVASACSTFRNNVRRTWFKEGSEREREDRKDYSRLGKRAKTTDGNGNYGGPFRRIYERRPSAAYLATNVPSKKCLHPKNCFKRLLQEIDAWHCTRDHTVEEDGKDQ